MFEVIKVFMKENGKTILFMDLEYINSEVEYIEDIGKIIKWMDMENLFEKKEKNIMVFIRKKKIYFVFFFGLITNFFVDFGKMENKIVLEIFKENEKKEFNFDGQKDFEDKMEKKTKIFENFEIWILAN